MAEGCEFSLNHFRETLELARKRYLFLRFKDADRPRVAEDPIIFLRHDVDLSLDDAVVMAEAEYDLFIRSTYFVQLRSPFYNVMDLHGHQCLQRIRSMGHEIGFHYDVSYYLETHEPVVAGFQRDLALLGALVGEPVVSIARHVPTMDLIERETELRIASCAPYDAFSDRFFSEIKYLSDSGCNWRAGCWCGHLEEGRNMQVVIHPVWWVNGDGDWEERVLKSCRNTQDRYTQGVTEFIRYNSRYLKDRKKLDKKYRAARLSRVVNS